MPSRPLASKVAVNPAVWENWQSFTNRMSASTEELSQMLGLYPVRLSSNIVMNWAVWLELDSLSRSLFQFEILFWIYPVRYPLVCLANRFELATYGLKPAVYRHYHSSHFTSGKLRSRSPRILLQTHITVRRGPCIAGRL